MVCNQSSLCGRVYFFRSVLINNGNGFEINTESIVVECDFSLLKNSNPKIMMLSIPLVTYGYMVYLVEGWTSRENVIRVFLDIISLLLLANETSKCLSGLLSWKDHTCSHI